MNISNRKIYYGFTLVELIVVVTIITILATISFISFSSYTGKSRDSNRLFSIKEISKALEIQKENTGKYPVVDGSYATGGVKVSTTDVKLFEVGVVGKNVSDFIKLGGVPLDPKTNGEYLYGLSDDNKNFQLAGTLENEQLSFFIDKAYADGGYNAYVEGNYLGALKFNYNSTDYIANIPSLIFSRKGTYSGGDKFVINGGTNLPYILDNSLKTGTGATDIEILKQYYGTGAKEEIKSYPIGNIKDKTNIENISKELGIPPIIIAKVVDNKELIVEYSKNTGGTTSNSGDTGGNGNVVYKIDFEDPNKYSINNNTNIVDDYWEVNEDEKINNKGIITTDFRKSGEKSFYSNGDISCVSFNLNTNKNFKILLNYRTDNSKEIPESESYYIDLYYKFNGSYLREINGGNPEMDIETLTDFGFLSKSIGSNEDWTQIELDTNENNNRNLLNKYFKLGNYNFELCSYDDGLIIDDIEIIESEKGCGIKPNYTNAVFTYGIPGQKNQSWSLLNGSQSGCYYKCNKGYGGNDCNTEVPIDKEDIMNEFLLSQPSKDSCGLDKYELKEGSDNKIELNNKLYFIYNSGCKEKNYLGVVNNDNSVQIIPNVESIVIFNNLVYYNNDYEVGYINNGSKNIITNYSFPKRVSGLVKIDNSKLIFYVSFNDYDNPGVGNFNQLDINNTISKLLDLNVKGDIYNMKLNGNKIDYKWNCGNHYYDISNNTNSSPMIDNCS